MELLRLSSVDDFSTQDAYLEQIHLWLQQLEVDCKYKIYK
jgi:hypothetical protein